MTEFAQIDVRNQSSSGMGRPRPLLSLIDAINRKRLWVPGLLLTLFLGALFWAKANDPFQRIWVTLEPAGVAKVDAVIILPKPVRPMPIVIFVHDRRETHIDNGIELRQMAEMGLAAASFNYDQASPENFQAQLAELYTYLGKQPWARNQKIAWVGAGRGAEWMLQVAWRSSTLRPDRMFLLGGQAPDAEAFPRSENLPLRQTPVLLVRGEEDVSVSAQEAKRLHQFLEQNGIPVETKTVSGLQPDLEPERSLLFRVIGENSLHAFGGATAFQAYRSVAQWRQNAGSLWGYLIPAICWVGFWLYAIVIRENNSMRERSSLTRWEKGLRYLGVGLALLAVGLTAIHVVVPHLKVTPSTLRMAERFLVTPGWRDDFNALKTLPVWSRQRLRTLLTHVELSNYNRELINWKLDDALYRDFVLSPVITANDQQWDWRRPLWESFYPRIRKEESVYSAARIVVRHLRERVTIAAGSFPAGIEDIWLGQITDRTGFELTYVAALRSVGIAARLNSENRAELWDGVTWQLAPAPAIERWDAN